MPDILAATGGHRVETGSACQRSAEGSRDVGRKVRSLRIAVAVADPAVQRLYQEVLAPLGHQVCAALTGRHLAEQCRLLRPDLLITEIDRLDLDRVLAAE